MSSEFVEVLVALAVLLVSATVFAMIAQVLIEMAVFVGERIIDWHKRQRKTVLYARNQKGNVL